MTAKKQVAVLGGGSFGTVLANIAASNGYQVSLWVRFGIDLGSIRGPSGTIREASSTIRESEGIDESGSP